MTPEQLKKNIAVADKLGISGNVSLASERVQVVRNCELVDFDPCNDPRDYMPLAIEYGIRINPEPKGVDQVYCGFGYRTMKPTTKAKTGEAVVDAFLIMNITGE